MNLADQAATEAAGFLLGERLKIGDIIALSGDLGAGKTCLARGMLRGLGLSGEVPSPTFPIMISYSPPDVRLSVHHIDLYRLDSPNEVLALALEDALFDGALVVEWPDLLDAHFLSDALQITINRTSDDARRLTAQVPPSWKDRWPFP